MSFSSRLMKIGEHVFRVNLCDSKISIIEFEKTGLPDIDKLLMALMSDEQVRLAILEYQESIADKEIYAKVNIYYKTTSYTVDVMMTSFENGKEESSRNLCVTVDQSNNIIQIREMNIGEFMELVNKLFPNLINMSPKVLQKQSGVVYLDENYSQITSLIKDGYHEHVKFKFQESF